MTKPEGNTPHVAAEKSQDIVLRRPAGVENEGSARRGGADFEGQPLPPGGGVATYLHAMRRRWLVATLLGLLIGGAAAPAVWFAYRPQYTAVRFIHIAATPQSLVFNADHNATGFEIYKKTQQQYFKMRYVLIAAVRNPEFADFACFGDLDPVDWLARSLQVSFPGDAEFMSVSLRGDNPDEMASLVNAVVEAYKSEVVDAEDKRRRDRLNDLDKLCGDKVLELRTKLNQLASLSDKGRGGERDTVSANLQRMVAFRTELLNAQVKLMLLRGELATRKEAQKTGKIEITDRELDAAVRTDPDAARLAQKLTSIEETIGRIKNVLTPSAGAKKVQHSEREHEETRKALAARRENRREELKDQRLSGLDGGVRETEAEIAKAAAKETMFQGLVKEEEKSLTAAGNDATKFGGPSIDLQMLHAEIALAEGTFKTVADEREKLTIEKGSRPRITVLEKADPPGAPDQNKKVQLTVFAGLAGLFVPIGLILWWDVRSRRVNTASELILGTGLDVIGAMPLVPDHVLGHFSAVSGRALRWRSLMNESVDGIAARLLYKAECDQTRVVLVSSAVEGEGKTTVATQLALSLARTGHRTALVDFDLRCPSLDEVFSVPLEPGVAEALRNEVDLDEAIEETEIDNLSVLTAGRGDRRTLKLLANGAVRSLFTTLRAEYEFVVVDGSPILPVVDARFVCQHVDAVVFSVLRDVSRMPNILAACDILASFGIRPFGAVVTGTGEQLQYQRTGTPQE